MAPERERVDESARKDLVRETRPRFSGVMQRQVLPTRTAAAREPEVVRTGRSAGRTRVPSLLRLQRDAGGPYRVWWTGS